MNSRYLKSFFILSLRPSFSRADAEQLGIGRGAIDYYKKTGIIQQISHGYYFIDRSDLPKIRDEDFIEKDEEEYPFEWEELIRTINSIPKGILCSITALSIWGLTDEYIREVWVAVPYSHRVPTTQGVRGVRFRNMELGRTMKNLGKWEVPIFDPYRSVVDAFRLLDLEFAMKSLRILLKKDPSSQRKLLQYSKILRTDIKSYVLGALI